MPAITPLPNSARSFPVDIGGYKGALEAQLKRMNVNVFVTEPLHLESSVYMRRFLVRRFFRFEGEPT